MKDYVKIYMENAPQPVLTLMNMKTLEDLLPSGSFIRVHRSFIVQKSKIRVIDRGHIVFGNVRIPIGDSYKASFQSFIDS